METTRLVEEAVVVIGRTPDRRLVSVGDEHGQKNCVVVIVSDLGLKSIMWFGADKARISFVIWKEYTWDRVQIPIQRFFEQLSGRTIGTVPLRPGYS